MAGENSDIRINQNLKMRSVREIYSIFFRHKWKIILFSLCVIITVILVSFVKDEIYLSGAKLMVRLGRENMRLDPTAATGQVINISQSRTNEINSEKEILKSQELVRKVVEFFGSDRILGHKKDELHDTGTNHKTLMYIRTKINSGINIAKTFFERFGLSRSLNDNDRAMLRITKNLKVDTLKESNIIIVSYEAQSPDLARDVVAKLIDLYLEKHINVYKTPGSYEFFSRQSADLRATLVKAETELRDIKNSIGVGSPPEQRLIVMNRIGELKQQIEITEAELSISETKIQEMQKILESTTGKKTEGEIVGFLDYGADMLRTRLYELQIEAQDLSSKFSEESQQVKMIRNEVDQAQALLNERNINSIRSKLSLEDINLLSLKSKVKKLKNQLEGAQAELNVINDADLKITQLTRDIDIYNNSYHKYSDSLEQARIDYALEAVNISNISIVQSATFPIQPTRTGKSLYIILGILLCIFGSFALALFFESIDDSIKTPEQVNEDLQLPTLASIPCTHSVIKNGKAAKKYVQSFTSLGEQMLLKTNGTKKSTRTIAITSSQPGEGVSTIAVNISTWLAKHDNGNVLLMDANTSNPSVHQFFKKRLSPGLVDIFNSNHHNGDCISESSVGNLHIMSAGISDINLSEVLEPNEFNELLQKLQTKYSYIVIDLPAVSQTSFVPLLSKLCDDVVIVVEAERSRWEVVKKIKEQLLISEAHIRGVVLNKRRFYIPQWLYQSL